MGRPSTCIAEACYYPLQQRSRGEFRGGGGGVGVGPRMASHSPLGEAKDKNYYENFGINKIMQKVWTDMISHCTCTCNL